MNIRSSFWWRQLWFCSKQQYSRGAWVAHLVERPTSAQVMMSRSVSSSPGSSAHGDCFWIISVINEVSITARLPDYFLRRKNHVWGRSLRSSQWMRQCLGVGSSHLFGCILQYNDPPDFVDNTSWLSGTSCIANIILVVTHIPVSSWLPSCLSTPGTLWPEVSLLSVSLTVWMLLPFAFRPGLFWLFQHDLVKGEEQAKSVPLMGRQFIQAAGKFISVASWYPRWKKLRSHITGRQKTEFSSVLKPFHFIENILQRRDGQGWSSRYLTIIKCGCSLSEWTLALSNRLPWCVPTISWGDREMGFSFFILRN